MVSARNKKRNYSLSKKQSSRNNFFANHRILIKKINKLETELNNKEGGYVRLITTCSKVRFSDQQLPNESPNPKSNTPNDTYLMGRGETGILFGRRND